MKVCVVGYGAMGHIVCELLENELAYPVGLECEYKKLEETDKNFDCIIDFSNPANLDMIFDFAKRYKKPVVFATTGYTENEVLKIKDLSKHVPVLQSANFSLGVILLNRLVKEITPILKDSFDIEIMEAHHHHKVDSPSGTAKMLLNTAVEATGFIPNYERLGYSPRKPNEIGVHSIRGGSIVGEHEVLYCGEDEIIALKHSAHSKKIFAVGAIKAAHFLVEQPVGYYDMEDVLFGGTKQ
ncbi:MAG: 4-hydroxy-tetrahydrodipicolinate reductase [Anaeroplasmataceae bacterium]|nr:4-hydroxy-tetrahydrodipicolinate reductase [Anaeroplasmataceae bacterium]MDE6414656.1 4-hydroxy-tetrahydrodipicolinate reductase [Anaeroplasmataceae bacterium]